MTSILMRNLLGSGLVIIVLYGAYYFIDRNGYQRCQTEHAEANKVESSKQAQKIKEAAEKHDEDTATINNLARELNKRMRIHIPVCPASPQGDQDGTSRLAAERYDEALAEFKRGMDSIGERCAKLNVDAIESNNAR